MSEHPIETARRALREAVALERDERLRCLLRGIADDLPVRGPLSAQSPPGNVVTFPPQDAA